MWKILNKNKQQDKQKTREPSQTSNISNSVEEKKNNSVVGSFRKEESRPSAIQTVIQNVRKSDSFASHKWSVKERQQTG